MKRAWETTGCPCMHAKSWREKKRLQPFSFFNFFKKEKTFPDLILHPALPRPGTPSDAAHLRYSDMPRSSFTYLLVHFRGFQTFFCVCECCTCLTVSLSVACSHHLHRVSVSISIFTFMSISPFFHVHCVVSLHASRWNDFSSIVLQTVIKKKKVSYNAFAYQMALNLVSSLLSFFHISLP
jgi:hypothetical protein